MQIKSKESMDQTTPARSLFEIGERATAKIVADQKMNAKKSMQKIKEITKKRAA